MARLITLADFSVINVGQPFPTIFPFKNLWLKGYGVMIRAKSQFNSAIATAAIKAPASPFT